MPGQTMKLSNPQLEITWPDGSKEFYDLGADIVRVGRQAETNDLVIPSQFTSISRQHFELRKENFQYRVADLESPSLVYVNGKKVTNQFLKDGDVISIGDRENNSEVQFRYIYEIGKFLIEDFDDESDSLGIFESGETALPVGKDYLVIRAWGGEKAFFTLSQQQILIGRDADAEIQIPANYRFVSRQHADIRKTEIGYQVRDLGSDNGTMVNGQLLVQGQVWELHDGDIIRIGDENFGVSVSIRFIAAVKSDSPEGYRLAFSAPTVASKNTAVLIGRDEDCDIFLDTPKVSRQHAKIIAEGDGYILRDLGSTNGTTLNGEYITKVEIVDGDQIQIGDHLLYFDDGTLHQYNGQGMRVDVVDLTKDVRTRSGKLRILDNIDMSVLSREFVAIVGGSGAGKTTLINALLGINPGDGQVLVNGHNFYEEYEIFRDQIGYVPQNDILHTPLTVERSLDYTILMRLPYDITKRERKKRINLVLETVNMNTDVIKRTRIRNLSGGQRKRISIAAELLADPKLLYLDEPTSGLDPGLEKKMMYTLRQMADQGRTVVLITHATANIIQVDHVAFLSQGRLVFFGSPNEALEFFEVSEFADIYERIENQGAFWQDVFTTQKKTFYEKYIVKRREMRKFLPIPESMKKTKAGIQRFFRQLFVLTRRAFNIQASDLISLGLLAALYPFTAILQLLISTPDVLVGDLAIMSNPIEAAKTLVENYAPFIDTRLFVFISGLEAVLIGLYVPSNELILERSIYLRERMVNLRVPPYLFSKILLFSTFSFVQCILYLVVLSVGVDFPEQGVFFPAVVEIFIAVFITMVSSVGIGLFVSSLARSPAMAMYVMVMLLFFQFFFAGVIFDLRGKAIQPLQNITSTHWAMVALGSTIDLPKFAESTILCNKLPDNPRTSQPNDELIDCRHYPEAVDDLQLKYGKDELLKAWAMLLGIGVFFYTLTGISIWRLDKI